MSQCQRRRPRLTLRRDFRPLGGRLKKQAKLAHTAAPHIAIAGALAAVALVLAPGAASACACGCSVFDVGANAAFPNTSDTGLSVFFRYDYMDQDRNWVGASSAPSIWNADKSITTDFYTIGGQYMINHDWGVMVELPVFDRVLTTTGDGTAYPQGSVYSSRLTDLGDIMLYGMYDGFSPDLSTGVSFGLKLPTGNYTGPYVKGVDGNWDPTFDRDSLPGTGSTDLLFGAYHVGPLSNDGKLDYFVQARFQMAVMERASQQGTYRPGNEFDGGAGLTYDMGSGAGFNRIAPVLQLLVQDRHSDSGTDANASSGYRRLLIAPGIDLRVNKVKLYIDVLVPVATFTIAPAPTLANIYGDGPPSQGFLPDGDVGQLVPSAIWRFQIGYDF